MKYTNITTIKEFIIIGFPGLPPEYYGPVSVLLLLLFLAIVIGNGFTIAVIIFERTLHKPIYVIFSNLAMTDICFGVVTLPKIIARYWWNDMVTSFGACFTQMYFVHSLGAIQSLNLLMMALDRFVAIWFLFKYPILFTNKAVAIACTMCWVLTFIWLLGTVFHALTLPYCDQNIIMQCYCDHISITRLGCGDEREYVYSVALANAMVTLRGITKCCLLVPLSSLLPAFTMCQDALFILLMFKDLISVLLFGLLLQCCRASYLLLSIQSYTVSRLKTLKMRRFKKGKVSIGLKTECK